MTVVKLAQVEDPLVKIDRGIPAPRRRGGVRKYPWLEMEVGDSFLFSATGSYPYEAARTASKRYAPKRFRAGKSADGMRVWRTE